MKNELGKFQVILIETPTVLQGRGFNPILFQALKIVTPTHQGDTP
jgi:hypothetical protein